MYGNLQLAKKYIHYYINASNSRGHGMHSPFVFRFIREVLNGPSNEEWQPIESRRKELLSDKRTLEITDLGAGSRKGMIRSRSVKQLAASALKPPKLAAILYRLAKTYKPSTIIELGTSLGITTSYFSKAVPGARIISIEGSDKIAAIARENFKKLGCDNIELLTGNFDEVLPSILGTLRPVDLVYIDGNHRYHPTMNYFHQILQHSDENTIMVFDDIHWSKEMEEAWKDIRNHPSVKYTIDIFYLGFVFFRNEFKVKQDFLIRI
jgi:predicted O-methyltransferase YrrM